MVKLNVSNKDACIEWLPHTDDNMQQASKISKDEHHGHQKKLWKCLRSCLLGQFRGEQGLLLLVWRRNIRNDIWKLCYRQSRRGVSRQDSEKCKTIVCIANTFTNRRFLHTDAFTHKAFTHRGFYTNTFTQNTFTHRSFYIRTLLHTDAFTHKRFDTQTLLHTDAFYTQTLFTHRRFHTQTHLHTEAFTHKHFYTNTFTHKHFYTQTLLHTDALTHRRFYTQTLLHTETFTHRRFLHTGAFTHRQKRHK